MQQAAEQLGYSAGSLKRVCRKLGLARWPYRVRKSLRSVIAKTEEFMVRCQMLQYPAKPAALKLVNACLIQVTGAVAGLILANKRIRWQSGSRR